MKNCLSLLTQTKLAAQTDEEKNQTDGKQLLSWCHKFVHPIIFNGSEGAFIICKNQEEMRDKR